MNNKPKYFGKNSVHTLLDIEYYHFHTYYNSYVTISKYYSLAMFSINPRTVIFFAA